MFHTLTCQNKLALIKAYKPNVTFLIIKTQLWSLTKDNIWLKDIICIRLNAEFCRKEGQSKFNTNIFLDLDGEAR